MRLAARSNSSAPVTTRRRSRICRQVSPKAGSSQLAGSEEEDRRQPFRQAIEDPVEHGADSAPTQGIRPVAIERVLADIEIEGREIDRAETMQLGIDRVEIEIADRLAHDTVELGQPMQHPALRRLHLR